MPRSLIGWAEGYFRETLPFTLGLALSGSPRRQRKAAGHLCRIGKLALIGKVSTDQSEPLPFLDLKSVSLGQGKLGDQHRGKAEDGLWTAAPAGMGCPGCSIRLPAPCSPACDRTQCKSKADIRSGGDVVTISSESCEPSVLGNEATSSRSAVLRLLKTDSLSEGPV